MYSNLNGEEVGLGEESNNKNLANPKPQNWDTCASTPIMPAIAAQLAGPLYSINPPLPFLTRQKQIFLMGRILSVLDICPVTPFHALLAKNQSVTLPVTPMWSPPPAATWPAGFYVPTDTPPRPPLPPYIDHILRGTLSSSSTDYLPTYRLLACYGDGR